MNSYILTFKRKVILSILLVFFSFVLFDLSLYYYIDKLTTEKYYINSKNSRIKKFELSDSENKDIIFVGNSRTTYHISTNKFKENDLQIYNFGISNIHLGDYASIVSKAIEKKPKKIVISLSISQLYEKLLIPKYPDLDEVLVYYKINKLKFFKTIYAYLLSYHKMLEYSERMYISLSSLYVKFNTLSLTKTESHARSQIINYDEIIECNYFDIRKIKDNFHTIKCQNGDGLILGTGSSLPLKKKNTELDKIDNESISFLNILFKKIKDNGIEPILILEPISDQSYSYDFKKIKEIIKDVHIVDLTNFSIKDNMWGDELHLNNEGRIFYTNYLIRFFK